MVLIGPEYQARGSQKKAEQYSGGNVSSLFGRAIVWYDFLQMIYNKMTNRLLAADMVEIYKEAFSPKVYKNLMLLDTVFSNPKNGDNYQILQQVFNKRKQETQAPSVFDV